MTSPTTDNLPLVWTPAGIVSRSDFANELLDDSAMDGRALIETTRTLSGRPWLWDRHIHRLQLSFQKRKEAALSIALPSASDVEVLVREIGAGDIVVRTNLSLDSSPKQGQQMWMDARKLPAAQESIVLRTTEPQNLSSFRHADLKGFRREFLKRQRIRAQQSDADDALILTSSGHVAESTWANVFLCIAGEWRTPALDGSLLPGTVRALICERKLLASLRECSVPVAELKDCSEAFVCNSVRGIVPVRQIDNHILPVGAETLALRTRIFELA